MFRKLSIAILAAFAPIDPPHWYKHINLIEAPLEPQDLPDEFHYSMRCLTGTPFEERNYSFHGHILSMDFNDDNREKVEAIEWIVAYEYAKELYEELYEIWEIEDYSIRHFDWRIYFANQILERI